MMIRGFFLCLLLLCLVIAGLFIVDVSDGITGMDHPEIPGMKHSYEGLYLQGNITWLAVLYGIGIVSLLSFAVGLGYQKRNRLGPFKPVFLLGLFGYLVVFGGLVLLYWYYERGELTDMWLGLPAPTAWMIYIMWSFPVIFTTFYVRYFHKWILTDEDFEEFMTLVKQKRASDCITDKSKA